MNTLKNFFKNTPLSKFIYPAILLLCALGIIVVFIFSTRFLTQEINRVFTLNTIDNSFSIDLANYKRVAHKLGLPEEITGTPASLPETASSTPITIENISASSTAVASTPALDTGAITIAVYNATSASGLAGKTKNTLVAAGFVVAKTDNAKAQTANTIALKESALKYLPLLHEALGTSFSNATVITAPTDAPYDAVITVGEK